MFTTQIEGCGLNECHLKSHEASREIYELAGASNVHQSALALQ